MKIQGNTVGTPMRPDVAVLVATEKLTEDQKEQVKQNLGTAEVFIAEYGVTTHAELQEAYNAGKVLFCQDGSYLAHLYQVTAGGSYAFYRVTNNLVTNSYCSITGWGRQTIHHTPGAHGVSHGANGSDPITPESIGAASVEQIGDIESALDSIIEIQNTLIGGDGV